MIEDLLMDQDMLWFSHWYQSDDWDGLPAFPCLGDRSSRVCTHFAIGDQPCAGSASKATPPLIPFGLGPDGRFGAALEWECQQVCTPFERTPVVDSDLLAAAYMSSRPSLCSYFTPEGSQMALRVGPQMATGALFSLRLALALAFPLALALALLFAIFFGELLANIWLVGIAKSTPRSHSNLNF